MNRSDFLAQLKRALENDLNAQAVKENVDYYAGYIEEEVRNGQSEQEVLDMLGDPWAIARTILMSSEMNGQEYSSNVEDVQERRESNQKNARVHVFGLDNWWKKAAVIVAIVAIIAIIIAIISGIISLIAPIAVPVLVVMLIVNMFKKNR